MNKMKNPEKKDSFASLWNSTSRELKSDPKLSLDKQREILEAQETQRKKSQASQYSTYDFALFEGEKGKHISPGSGYNGSNQAQLNTDQLLIFETEKDIDIGVFPENNLPEKPQINGLASVTNNTYDLLGDYSNTEEMTEPAVSISHGFENLTVEDRTISSFPTVDSVDEIDDILGELSKPIESFQTSQRTQKHQSNEYIEIDEKPPPLPPRPRNIELSNNNSTSQSYFYPNKEFKSELKTQRMVSTPRRPPVVALESNAERVRQLNIAQAEYDKERFSVQDKVDERLQNWQKGKELNLRALLISINDVLWENVDLKRVNMAELLLPNKVKIAYVRAISKVHPDKIPRDATVEQRMIAAGVFSQLNNAWTVFKTENDL